MNQENNFNAQGINGVPNNQIFSNKPSKKKKLGLIIGIVCLIVIVIVAAIVLLTNSPKKENNSSNNNETNESTNNNIEEEISSVKLPHEIFDVNKFDSTLFKGVVYDSNQTQYNVMDLFQTDHTICIKGCYPSYYLTIDKDAENDSLNQRSDSTDNRGIDFILKTLGNPSTIYENYFYYDDDKDMKTGWLSLLYNYGDYIIDIGFYDYRQWKNYNYDSLEISHVMIYTRDRFNNEWAPFFQNYKGYGEKLF